LAIYCLTGNDVELYMIPFELGDSGVLSKHGTRNHFPRRHCDHMLIGTMPHKLTGFLAGASCKCAAFIDERRIGDTLSVGLPEDPDQYVSHCASNLSIFCVRIHEQPEGLMQNDCFDLSLTMPRSFSDSVRPGSQSGFDRSRPAGGHHFALSMMIHDRYRIACGRG
jgi:hypothetical protein